MAFGILPNQCPNGRSMPMVCSDCIRGVPPFGLPKIERSWDVGSYQPRRRRGMVDMGEDRHTLRFDGGLEPLHGLFRCVAALDCDQLSMAFAPTVTDNARAGTIPAVRSGSKSAAPFCAHRRFAGIDGSSCPNPIPITSAPALC
jgi:hypothetical protein